MRPLIAVIDYGMGNLRSVQKALEHAGADARVTDSPEVVRKAQGVVLPGVGAFGAAMEKIKANIPLKVLEREVLEQKKPFLGICVGLQVLADKGFEFGEHLGLGWVKGTVDRIESGDLPLPHVGWNNIKKLKDSPLLSKFDDNQDFYFVHSYKFSEVDWDNAVASTEYGQQFTSVVAKGNIFGVQFHPEKSQKAGKILLNNFLEIR